MEASLLAQFDKLETLAFGSEPFLALRTECRNAIDTLGGLDAYHPRASDGGRGATGRHLLLQLAQTRERRQWRLFFEVGF
jgi:hypothetical protein